MFQTQFRLHFIVLLWGFTGIMGKLISLDALPIVFWRTFIAIFAIGITLKVLGVSFTVTKKQLINYLLIGVIMGLHWILFFAAIKVSNVSVALSTLSTGALFAAFIEPFFYKRKIKLHEIILSLIVVGCLWFIFKASPEYWLGIVLGVICASLSATFTVLNGILQKDNNNRPRKMMFYEMIGAFGIVCLILPFFIQSGSELAMNGNDWLWFLILGTALTAYPMIESVQLMKYMSPYTLVLAVNMEPIYSIILAFFIFGQSEQMSSTFYIAAFVMIAVILLNQLIQIRQKGKNKIQFIEDFNKIQDKI